LPQRIPVGYVKRTAATLVLRPPTLRANWADVGRLEAFLTQQVARYGELSTPTVVFAGDCDPLAPPAQHAAKLAAATPKVQLAVLSGLGHMLHHGAADRIVAAVDEMENAAAHSLDSAS
jgi:pimeloyl-ACP methyl ester carboxylesterase